MKAPDIRPGTKPFADRAKFPYGFRKSGDFSITEADLLTRYGNTLLALEQQQLTPQTLDETHFVEVMQGIQVAHTVLEKTWLKYVRLARGKRHFYTLHSSASNQPDFEEDFSTDDYDVAG